jgi:hypothetical protein
MRFSILILHVILIVEPSFSLRKYKSPDKNLNSMVNLRSPKVSLLTEKAISKINTLNNPLKYGANYIISGKYLDEQDEYNLKNAIDYTYQDDTCFFNRGKFIDYLNMIRDKHSVLPMSWSPDLEEQAKIFAYNIKTNNECRYKPEPSRKFIGEAAYENAERITEKELLQNWYKPAYYYYNFKNVTENLNLDIVGTYSMALLLWDEVKEVGCAKVCCSSRELNICHFSPVVTNPNIFEMEKHIKPNKYLEFK